MKKILSLLIIALMLCSVSVCAAPAPENYADMLKELKIMQGDPDGNMRYDSFVSRAECVKIAVAASSFRDSVATGSKTSPFSDVPYSHWASPYITVGVKNGLCKGYLDATFRPDNTVLYEEATTMFLRILGYGDEDFGASWPDGPVGIAKNSGVLDNIHKTTGEELTRKDIAIMAYNTLTSRPKNAQSDYISTFNRTIMEDVVLISTNKEDSSIADGKIFTSGGTYKYTDSLDLSYIGQKGDVVLRDNDTIVSFIPQSNISKTETYMVYSVLGDGVITYNNGAFSRFELENSTTVYKDSTAVSAGSVLPSLKMGDVLKVSYDSHNAIEYVTFYEGTTSGPETVKSSDWYTMFGADSDITIMRDGTKATVSDVKTNDIVYYLSELDIALVYSKKITGIYEAATPNKDTPAAVTVSGVTYNIEGIDAFQKLSSSGSFELGDTVTLLLGKSGDVADVLSNSQLSDTVYGFLTESGTKQTTVSGSTVTKPYVKVILPSGEAREYITGKDYSSILNKAVSVTLKNGTATVSANTSNNDVSGKIVWNSSAHKIGTTPLSADVEIIEVSTTASYETATTATVFPQRLNGVTVSASNVLYAHKNTDGRVDAMILADTTGDMHTYGILTKAKNNTNEMSVSGSYEYIANGTISSVATNNKAYNVATGQVVKITSDGRGVTSMTAINKAASGSITDITGSVVTVGGKAYTLSDNVQVYVKKSYDYTMITLDELKSLMSEYSAAVYQDKTEISGGRVRVIVLS